MCAGKGKRLMPLTEDRPKTMVAVGGKPIIYWILTELKKLDVNNIYLIVGYREGILKSYVKYTFSDMPITFIHQKEQTGTADAIFLVKDYIRDDFIVLSGDILYTATEIKALMNVNNSLLYTKQEDRLYEYGTLDVDENNLIKFINEKSTNPTSDLINCGAYHFTPCIFYYISITPYDERFNERIITNTINMTLKEGAKFYGIPIVALNEISYPDDIQKVEKRCKL